MSAARYSDAQVAEARTQRHLGDLLAHDGIGLKPEGDEYSGLCPFHNERTPSFRVYKDHYHCFGCGAHGDAIGWRIAAHGETFVQAIANLLGEAPPRSRAAPATAAAPAAKRDRSALARTLWNESSPIAGTPGEAWFRSRGIKGELPPTLRWNRAMRYGPREERCTLPGWVAAVQDSGGRIVAVHRGFLDPVSLRTVAPRKARVAHARALLGVTFGRRKISVAGQHCHKAA